MLQCHPHPCDFSDKSKPFHCSYFIGLQRKEGVPVNGANKFDIRVTVDEFKANVGSYLSWKPGMEINVTHIRRRDIPAFVFPGGIRPTRAARVSVELRRATEHSAASSITVDEGTSVDVNVVDRPDDDTRKRKREDDDVFTKVTAPKLVKIENKGVSVGGPQTAPPMDINVIDQVGTSGVKTEILDQHNEDMNGSLTSKEAEKLAIEKLMSGPYESFQSSPPEPEELEELDNSTSPDKSFKGNNMEFLTNKELANSVTASNNIGTSSSVQLNGILEELEVSY